MILTQELTGAEGPNGKPYLSVIFASIHGRIPVVLPCLLVRCVPDVTEQKNHDTRPVGKLARA